MAALSDEPLRGPLWLQPNRWRTHVVLAISKRPPVRRSPHRRRWFVLLIACLRASSVSLPRAEGFRRAASIMQHRLRSKLCPGSAWPFVSDSWFFSQSHPGRVSSGIPSLEAPPYAASFEAWCLADPTTRTRPTGRGRTGLRQKASRRGVLADRMAGSCPYCGY